jgi:four helix bundle protein
MATARIASYRDVKVWRKGMDLVVACYRLTERLPRSELYGMVSQIRRAALSIPSNIAEGHGRSHTREYLRHLSFAKGSLMELETQLIAANRLEFLDESATNGVLSATAEIGRMLSGLSRRLKEHCSGP